MPFFIVENDIVRMPVDAIVNAANNSLLGGGGVDGCIHRAAGPRLLEECRTLGGCRTGEAKITAGYDLPASYVIHTVGPVWRGGGYGEEEQLRSCYRRSMELAVQHHCQSLAFPLISAGAYRYPGDQAVRIAVEEIGRFLRTQEMTVYLVVYNRNYFYLDRETFEDLTEFIFTSRPIPVRHISPAEQRTMLLGENLDAAEECAPVCEKMSCQAPFCGEDVSEELRLEVENLDESFSESLLRRIDESGMTDAECYKKANIDRKLFSKIRSDRFYRPKKPTVIAFAVALELSLEETKDLLEKAGFALSRSSQFDVIVEFFISRGNYDIYKINTALFSFDQVLLGS